jgi:hypothetical protein
LGERGRSGRLGVRGLREGKERKTGCERVERGLGERGRSE